MKAGEKFENANMKQVTTKDLSANTSIKEADCESDNEN